MAWTHCASSRNAPLSSDHVTPPQRSAKHFASDATGVYWSRNSAGRLEQLEQLHLCTGDSVSAGELLPTALSSPVLRVRVRPPGELIASVYTHCMSVHFSVSFSARAAGCLPSIRTHTRTVCTRAALEPLPVPVARARRAECAISAARVAPAAASGTLLSERECEYTPVAAPYSATAPETATATATATDCESLCALMELRVER